MNGPTQRTVIAAVALIFVVSFLVLLGQRSAPSGAAGYLPSSFTSSSSFRCQPDQLSLLRRAANPNSPNVPILNLHQLTYISNIVRGSLSSSPTWRTHNFLVYGLGYDSLLWQNANCDAGSQSHTLFVEDADDWIKTVVNDHPYLDVLSTKYNSLVSNIPKDIKNLDDNIPDMPQEIADACWDVTLVDAPLGFDQAHPGRLIPSTWTLRRARDCLRSGQRDVVYAFLHDVERNGEQMIMEKIFDANGIRLGRINQPKGDLAGWMFTAATLQN